MKITLGQLADKFKELIDAIDDVDRAERSLTHGGRPDTMAHKERDLRNAKQRLGELRDHVLIHTDNDKL